MIFSETSPPSDDWGKPSGWLLRGLFVSAILTIVLLIKPLAVAQTPISISSPDGSTIPIAPEPVVVIDQRAADKVRGGYVYSFSRFVAWQKPNRNNFQIAVVGNSRLAKLMASVAKRKKFTDRLTGKKVPIHAKFYKKTATIAPCDLLYIGTNVSLENRNAILNQFANSNTLMIADDTTTEHPFDSSVNTTVRFVLQGGSVKFQLNLRDARQRGLKIDAKLLTAASLILPDDGTEPSVNSFSETGAN